VGCIPGAFLSSRISAGQHVWPLNEMHRLPIFCDALSDNVVVFQNMASNNQSLPVRGHL
jgi:hypothetical protein